MKKQQVCTGWMIVPKSNNDGQTITRKELSEAVYTSMSLPRKDAAALVDEVIDEICDGLVREGIVKISRFGKLTVKSRTERMGRNPKTRDEHVIAARRTISFKPAPELKKKINGSDQDDRK
jgi:integration host factor subunit alpha